MDVFAGVCLACIQAAGFALVPLMPTVWSLTALFFVISFSYNFTNSAVFTSLGWMFPKKSGSVSTDSNITQHHSQMECPSRCCLPDSGPVRVADPHPCDSSVLPQGM